MFGIARVIVGTSGSPGSLQALRYGEAMARECGATLIPALAWEPPGAGFGGRIYPPGELNTSCHELAGQRLRDALTAVWGDVPDDPLVQPYLERGPTGWVLVSLAGQPGDVLVLGAGRRSALSRPAYSKVGRYCLAHAQCPVIAVPPPELTRELGHGCRAWMFRHRPLTLERLLRHQGLPAC